MPTPRHSPKILTDVNVFISCCVYFLPFCGCGAPTCLHWLLFALLGLALLLRFGIPASGKQ